MAHDVVLHNGDALHNGDVMHNYGGWAVLHNGDALHNGDVMHNADVTDACTVSVYAYA